MKKMIISAMIAVMALTVIPVQSFAAVEKTAAAVPAPKSTEKESAEVNTLALRLNEINKMDRSKMTSTDKKALRKEVKSIKKRLHEISGSVYIPAILLIVLVILLVALL